MFLSYNYDGFKFVRLHISGRSQVGVDIMSNNAYGLLPQMCPLALGTTPNTFTAPHRCAVGVDFVMFLKHSNTCRSFISSYFKFQIIWNPCYLEILEYFIEFSVRIGLACVKLCILDYELARVLV